MQHVFENQNDQEQQGRCRGQGKNNHNKEARLSWGNWEHIMYNVSGKVRVRKRPKPGLTIKVFLQQKKMSVKLAMPPRDQREMLRNGLSD